MKDNFVMIIAICAPTSGDILCENVITNVTTTAPAPAPAQIKDNRSAAYLRILQTNRKPSCFCRAAAGAEKTAEGGRSVRGGKRRR